MGSGHARAGLSIAALALALRLAPVRFGFPLLLKPDENRMVEVAYAMGDARFCHWFLVYPHFTFIVQWVLFMAVFAAGWTFGIFPNFKAFRVWRHARPHVLHLVSRLPVVAAGALTAPVTQGLATRLFGANEGLLAALLIAVCPMHVKESMYFAVDVPMVLFALATLWLAVAFVERERPALLWAAGACGGLAAGTKYPAAVLAVPLTLAWAMARRRVAFRHLVGCGAVMIVVFFACTPIAVVHPGMLVDEIRILSARLGTPHGGIALGPGWLYHLTVSLPEGFTLPLALAGLAGLLKFGLKGPSALLTAFAVAAFATFARSQTVFQRYSLPLAPIWCVFAARACLAAHGALAARHGRTGRALGLALIAAVVAAPAARSLAYVEFLMRPDTRTVARAWVEQHVPPDTRIAMIGTAWVDIQLEKELDQDDTYRPERPPYLRLGRELGLTRWLPSPTYRVIAAASLADARAKGCAYAVLADFPRHPEMRLPDPVMAQAAAAPPLWALDPVRPDAGVEPHYDEQDAWLVPTSGFAALTQPGPRVRLWKL